MFKVANCDLKPSTFAIFLKQKNWKKFQYIPFWNELHLMARHI